MLSHGKSIASGSYGRVRICSRDILKKKKNLLTEEVYAQKTQDIDERMKVWYTLLLEMYIGYVLRHEYILPIESSKVHKKRETISFFYPYASKGTLEDFCKSLRSSPKDNYVLLGSVLGNIEEAVEKLHSCGFGHFDIKPQNILITEKDGKTIGLLCDFGLSQRNTVIHKTYSNFMITEDYRPPYMKGKHQKYNENADYYSLGVSILEAVSLLFGKERKSYRSKYLLSFISSWDRSEEMVKRILQKIGHCENIPIDENLINLIDKGIGFIRKGREYNKCVKVQEILLAPTHSEIHLLDYMCLDIEDVLCVLNFMRQWYPDDVQADCMYFLDKQKEYKISKDKSKRAKKYEHLLILSSLICLGYPNGIVEVLEDLEEEPKDAVKFLDYISTVLNIC